MPSQVKTRPASGCKAANSRMRGAAAACTSWLLVKIAGTEAALTARTVPVSSPPAKPQRSKRTETHRAEPGPPVARAMGSKACAATATESKAKSAKNQTRKATWCAAAARPPLSRPTTTCVNCRSTACSESVRSNCDKPPSMRGFSSANADGQVRAASHATKPRRFSKRQKAAQESQMEATVARAAPSTPMAGMPRPSTPKTRAPSSTTLARLCSNTTCRGVAVSSCPRKVPTATVFTRLAGSATARMRKYEAAMPPSAESGGAPANCSARGAPQASDAHVARPRKTARPMTRPVICAGSGASGSPLPRATTACATRGTVTTQRKL
mmetsp:Transcript_105083/g.338892  ORF Transcript_105083/g.338892 Transcript_105083/m.338892 type:complete len:326 (+) Transcript_105083:296-1273(+)